MIALARYNTLEFFYDIKLCAADFIDNSNCELKSWNELDRYQSMSAREKSDFNEASRKNVGAPSDPRKRRRASESSSKSLEIAPHGKVSPQSPTSEEPLSKVKRNERLPTNSSNIHIFLKPGKNLYKFYFKI